MSREGSDQLVFRSSSRIDDWFLPAIEAEGGVSDCFAAVTASLDVKRNFIKSLRKKLCEFHGKSTDSISELEKKVKEVWDTLHFRIGMLSPDRPGAWFRVNMNQGPGLFNNGVLTEPIFGKYEANAAGLLEESLAKSFHDRTILTMPMDRGGCIWLSLLKLNVSWDELDRLDRPFLGLRLSELPDALPLDLQTPSLIAFLDKVNEAHIRVRENLDSCYEKLMACSKEFWAFQNQNQKNGAGASSRKSRFHQQSKSKQAKDGDRARGARRASGRLPSVFDMRALEFMRFDDFPNRQELRQRYLTLANDYHPDKPGGNEERFKQLSQFYSHLSHRIEIR